MISPSRLIGLLLAAALVVACGESTLGPASTSTDPDTDVPGESTTTAPDTTATSMTSPDTTTTSMTSPDTTTTSTLGVPGETIPPTTTPTAVTGEVPTDFLAEVIDDASTRSGVPAGEIVVVRGEFVVWPDGSLGCPEPDQVYTQATVDGYWIVLSALGDDYDYRATATGYFKLCEPAVPSY